MINSINDTISAIATPLGTGGVGIIRISGEDSITVISKIFPSFKSTPNTTQYGWIVKPPENNPVDEVIVVYFKAPKSFTGEDVIEIHCHGGINIVKNILNLTTQAGARLAERGEFTKRAFLNNKIDLSKAEAILDIIHSKTDRFSELSANNLSGKLAQNINKLRQELINILSAITAAIDFPEEVAEPEYIELEQKTNNIIEEIKRILGTAKTSNLMRQGLKLAIVGKPNVGKSSLFNALLNIDRAIVTNIPGTTRDIIQESLDIAGIPVTLIDTAGIREIKGTHSSDQIESIGVDISKNCIKEADLLIFLSSLEEEMQKEDRLIWNEIGDKPVIKVGSKSDIAKKELLEDIKKENVMPVSVKTNKGLEELKKAIESKILQQDLLENSEFTTNLRQQECLQNTLKSLQNVLIGIQNLELQDFISIDLKAALLALGEITGEVVTEEILDNIFNNFCIGK